MQSRQVSNFKINKMTKAQYSGIVPSQDEVYITTDEADAVLSVNGILPNAQGNVTLNIPSAVTESTVAGWGFTKNEGTVTSVNNELPDADGNVTIQSGSSRNVGEIVTSTIPLTDAGLHLLDGALIQYGSYSAFVDYIAGLATDYPDLFDTEANWQNAVTTYGVCGKFVYDSVNNTVRLPKITGIVEGTTNVTALGDLVEAGLPNITGVLRTVGSNSVGLYLNGSTGAFANPSDAASGQVANTSGGTTYRKGNFDASLSNPIYGNSTTVQPQTIKVLYYIVIATSTKTEIEVDIDEIATDLNGKVDKSGDTMTGALKVQVGSTQITVANPEIEVGVIPESIQYAEYCFKDANDVILGNFYYRIGTDGDVSVRMYCNDLNHTGDQVGFRFGFDANGNKYCLFPRCTTVPTTTSTASNSLYAVIVKNYLNGTSWYRVWSDGFIEQGGYSTSTSATTTINLLRSFSDTNYNVSITWQHSSSTATYAPIVNITNTGSFTVFHNASGAQQCAQYWRACGY